MSTVAKNARTFYRAPVETIGNAAGVQFLDGIVQSVGIRIVKIWSHTDVECITYEGTQDELVHAGLVPAKMFSDVPKSGKKTGWFEHADGTQEPAQLSRRRAGQWRIRRRSVMA